MKEGWKEILTGVSQLEDMPMFYDRKELLKAYRWLGHQARGLYTEMVALDPRYRPGTENRDWNRANGTYPRQFYVRTERGAEEFVKRNGNGRTVCFRLNGDTAIRRNDQNYPRSAHEHEVPYAMSMLFDVDFKSEASKAQREAFRYFLDQKSDVYFLDLGLRPPERGETFRGFHQLFAMPPIAVADVPDIARRQKTFQDGYRRAFRQELDALEAKLDSTASLVQKWVCPGTRKAGQEFYRTFSGGERIEDPKLRDHLLSLSIDDVLDSAPNHVPRIGGQMFRIGSELPQRFAQLLEIDERARSLWNGEGKADGSDQSASGYDFSLTRHLYAHGFHALDDVATILALRPEGSVQKHGKGEAYLRATLGKALIR